MPTESTTKAQVQAYRFGMRRLELAVSAGQSYRRTLTGPRHNLSYLVGFGLAALTLAGFAVYGFIAPSPSIGSATVLVDKDSGGSFVLRSGRLYPAMNLSSALLAAGQAATSSSTGGPAAEPAMKTVTNATLAKVPKGQLLGIPGAPNQLPGESKLVPGSWAVCDTSTVNPALAPSSPPAVQTTAILGGTALTSAQVGNVAMLVSADGGSTDYVLWNGKRSRIDPTDRGVGVALGTDGLPARPISLGLLNAIPESAGLGQPQIQHAGDPVSWSGSVRVGSVFSVQLSGGSSYYVVLADGVQRITPLLADLIRTGSAGGAAVPTLTPATLAAAPSTKNPIPLDQYPATRPTFYSTQQAPVICLDWSGAAGDSSYAVYPTTALPLPAGAAPVPVPPDSPAGSASAVYVAPNHGAVIGQVTGNAQASTGALFLVTDLGVKYPVVSKAALTDLGLGKTINPAPPSLLNLLPTGPTLDPAVAAAFFGGTSGG